MNNYKIINNSMCTMDECIICFEELEGGIEVLKCNHKFHHKCLHGWSIYDNTCPMCRTLFQFDGPDYDIWIEHKMDRGCFNTLNEKIEFYIEISEAVIYCSKKYSMYNLDIYELLIRNLEEIKEPDNWCWCWCCTSTNTRKINNCLSELYILKKIAKSLS